MKTEHVPFEKMSDLHDNLIDTTEEKEKIVEHFGECTNCDNEYGRLKKMICHLEAFRDYDFCLTGISEKTMQKMVWRKRKNFIFKRALPAVAASFMLVTGFGLYNSGYLKAPDGNQMHGSMVTASMAGNDTARIVKIIGDHDAKIVKVSDLYVEGEIPYKDFNRLRRNLGFRKVVYNVTDRSRLQARQQVLNRNIETVGVTSSPGLTGATFQTSGKRDLYVRFRIFK